MTNSPTPAERLALKTANAALESPDASYDLVSTIVFALGSAQLLQSPETAAELVELRERVAELEAAAYGDAKVRLVGPVEQIQHLHGCVAAQMSRANTLDRLCREKWARVTELEAAAGDGHTRTCDEDPIAFALTEQAEALHASSGAVVETPGDVTPQVRRA